MSGTSFFSLQDHTALIIGGTDGIGLAVAKRFIQAGASVVIAGRRDGDAIADRVGAMFIRCDASVEVQQSAMFDEAERRLGKLSIVINNAGVENGGSTIEDQAAEELDRILGINLKGVYFGLKYAPRHMRDGGAIINTSSAAGLLGLYSYGQYAMTKAAVISLTKTAAIELAARGIRVNAVCPGGVRTAMLPEGHPEIAVMEVLTPLGRVAETDEVVGLYHFLASDDSRFITGQAIVIDGGVTTGPSVAVLERCLPA